MAVVVAFTALAAPRAQGQKIDPEQMLAARFGFSAAEIGEVRAGRAVARLLPTRDTVEVGVGGAVRIAGTPDRLVYWLKDVVSFRAGAQLGASKKLGSPPQIGDFAGLSLDSDELAALRTCRPGRCDLRLGDKAIARFQADVDWTASDAGRRAEQLTRELMLGHVQAYLRGGDEALGMSHNEKTPRLAADEFRYLLYQATALYELAPAFATYLDKFPAASLPGAESVFYWAKGGAGPDASISLHHLVVYSPKGGNALIADKQIYASRYTDASLLVISLVPAADGSGYYAMAGARGRSTMLGGITARVLRGRVEKAGLEAAKMYLDWIQQSLAMSR